MKWDGSESRFTDEQYERSCVLDRLDSGEEWADKGPKYRCFLPILEPNGDVNRQATKAAVERLAKVEGLTPGQLASAKVSLRSAFVELGESLPPELRERKRVEGEWGVEPGVARHGEIAVRMDPQSEWKVREASSGDSSEYLGGITGHFAVFDRWTEINNFFEGRFLESIAPGSFTKTFDENRSGMRCLLNHGRDPSVGMKPLGPIRELDQDDKGARYDVDLLDTSYNRDILPGLKADQYGASFRFQVIREEVNAEPGRSDHNPDGIEERVIKECHVREFGPVTFPAYADATAGLRSLNEELFDLDIGFRSLDPSAAAAFINTLRGGTSSEEPSTKRPSGRNVDTSSKYKDRKETAPSTEAPENKSDENKDETYVGPRDRGLRFSTLKSGAAGALKTNRDKEEASWRM
jgi:HK97 family phage prohead protease